MKDFLFKVLSLTTPYRTRLILGILCGFLAGFSYPLLLGSIKLTMETVFPEKLKDPKKEAPTLASQIQKAPAFVRNVLHRIVPNIERPSKLTMVTIILLIPVAMFLRGLFTYLNIYLMNWVSNRAITDLRVRLFEHLLTLSSSFFHRTSTGTLMAQLNATGVLQGTIGNSLTVFIKEPVTVISLVVYLLWKQPWLTLAAGVILPITLVPFVVYRRKVRNSSAHLQREALEQSKLIHESLTGYRIIKAYNLEPLVTDEFQKTSRFSVAHSMRMLRAAELPGPLIEFLGSIAVACLLIYIGILSPTNLTAADLMVFVIGIFALYQPIKYIIRLHNTLQQAQAAITPIFDLLATQPSIPEPTHPVPLDANGADVHFSNVSFAYDHKPVLRRIELRVKPGQMVALVGASGSGKTTLSNLLLRFYDPIEGSISIGGTDIRNVKSTDLRSQIAVVTQETILFNDTIGNNIALGRPGASAKEIEAAARHAYAHDFIMEKPQGYDTVVGEKGVTLSGGQRQRIAIARAILKNAPILILDEATNALDTESERAVQAALDELTQGRTTICIAHRLSTIQSADMIVVMEQGRIIETGRHHELIQRNGIYRKLYELQFPAELSTA